MDASGSCSESEQPDVASRVSKKGFDSKDTSLGLIPGLSNDVAQLCLARVARGTLPKLRFVCTTWKHLCESKDFWDLRYKVGSAEAWLYVLTEKPSGSPFKTFSPRLNKWFELPQMLKPSEDSLLQGFACAALGPTLLVMGGMYQSFDKIRQEYLPGIVSGDIQGYNSCTNQWSKAPNMKTPRSWFAAAVIGQCVYVAGGQGKDRFLNSVEVYDSRINRWSYAPNMNHVRSSCRGLAAQGKFWVIGGELMRNQYGERPERGSAEVYDPETRQWTLIPEMWLDTQKVPGPSTVHCGKLLFVHKSKLMMYDDVANHWYHVGYLSGVDMFNDRFWRFAFACESIDDELYIVAGLRGQKQNRHFVQALNTTEASKVRIEGPSKYTLWKNMASMGASEGIVLASAVVTL
ncbi:hypothetical protein GOP47_0027694 [Adiantum capillus-veneris]|nr:hypothetical protein GOP47_0027694 [Adiantum capillus-veneris]